MSGVGYKKKGENMKILTWFPLYNFRTKLELCCREYYLLIHAYEDFQELLVTAIVDTPPEYDNEVEQGPGFTIQRMGKPQ